MSNNKKSIIAKVVIVFMITYGLNAFANEFRPAYFSAVRSLIIDEGVRRCLMYMGHWVFFVVFALYALAVRNDRKYIFSFLHGKPSKNFKYALLGAVSGFVLMSICVMGAALHGDLTISSAVTMTVPVAILASLATFFAAAVEEIKFRGFLFGKMNNEGVPVIIATIVSSVVFSYVHAGNSGYGVVPFLSLFMLGAFWALSYYCFGTIWFAFTAHTMWNYSQDFLYGLPNSGSPAVVSFFNSTVKESGLSRFFYDEAFGIEGSYLAILVNLAVCIILMLIAAKKRKKEESKR